MMYMAFPLHGGLVESCHTAAENTNPAFGLFTRQKKKEKLSILLFASLLSAFVKRCCNGFYSISVTKKEEQNFSL